MARRQALLLLLFTLTSLIAISHFLIPSHYLPDNPFSNPPPDHDLHTQVSSIRPQDTTPHSRTLGIADAIFVVSLARSPERRAEMDTLAAALDLDIEYVDATDFSTPSGGEVVQRLMDRVRWQRPRIDDREAVDEESAHYPPIDMTKASGLIEDAFPFKWSAEASHPTAPLEGIQGADYWDLTPPDEEWERAHPLPSINRTWAETREGRIYSARVRNVLHPVEYLTKPIVATFHSHVRVLREIVSRNLSTAIILEDDVDIDFSIERTLALSFPALPQDWDMVYLGYCWSKLEASSPFLQPQPQPPLHTHSSPLLHTSIHPLCTHAYTISFTGALKLLTYLRSPDYAYSRPIDHAYKDLIQQNLIRSWTMVPAVVVQTKKWESEINLGEVNVGWKEALVDSTMERVGMVRAMESEL